ncbi:hypothetical protein [Peribacillus huizhouensis]|uniref:Uncharacterized protein n=1 Tax=Peribacillus huizhouensis TaxID=1501239 RepID=A0ABR6CS77_9BACI|nr:hypothetical protein [Peribacillus huizhouensis]MBA9027591.1 hypothetical protein [Peribacillus huizhouensis]
MSNDSIVLELFGRVQKLEEKVRFLEGKLESQEYVQEEDNEEPVKQTLVTRANSRDYVADRLQQENPQFSIRKANREEGSGLVLTDEQGEKLILKYYYSKSFLEFPSGWHTVDISDIENDIFDIYTFAVSYQEEYFVFFYTRDELKSFVSRKRLNSSTKYYFYFHIENGKIVEVRDDEYNVSKYYDRWDLPSQLV